MEQPLLHLTDRHSILRLQEMKRLNGKGLRRNAVVAPTVLSLRRIEITACLVGVDGVLTDAFKILLGMTHLAILREDHCRASLAVDRQLGS